MNAHGDRVREPYRAGPWPGVTARGAWVLVGYAGLLALGQLVAGQPRRPLPDLPLQAFLSCVPLLMATRVTRIPGAASAVCGAYLLPRTLLSVVVIGLEPPPLLIVPAVVLDALIWLRAADLVRLSQLWPRRHEPTRLARHERVRRELEPTRAALGGAAFGALLSVLVPPWATLLGSADPHIWSGFALWLGGLASSLLCAAEAWLISRPPNPRPPTTRDRDTES